MLPPHPAGVRSFRVFFCFGNAFMFGLFGTGILVIFVNLLSLCMKILNKILSTHAGQAVVSYFVVLYYSLRYILGKASARRGRK